MKKFQKVRSANCPAPVEIAGQNVWVHENISKITEYTGGQAYAAYEYDMMQYDKEEYQLLTAKNNR